MLLIASILLSSVHYTVYYFNDFIMFYMYYSRTCIIGVRAPPPPHDPPKPTFL